jgi:hypothetical protein
MRNRPDGTPLAGGCYVTVTTVWRGRRNQLAAANVEIDIDKRAVM